MYSIRNVTKEDLDVLSHTFSETFTQASPEKPWDEKHAQDYLNYWLEKQPDMFFCACNKDNVPIGAVAVNIKPWRTGVRCSDGVMFVNTNHQRKGVATMLLKKVINEAVSKYNAEVFEAITFADKKFPLEWYERIGIKIDTGAILIKGKCNNILDKLE